MITVEHCCSEVLLRKGPIDVAPQPDVEVVFWRWGEPEQGCFSMFLGWISGWDGLVPLQGHAVFEAWTGTEGVMREIDP